MDQDTKKKDYILACRAVALALTCVALVRPAAGVESTSRLPSVELPAELQRVLTDYEEGWQAGDEDALVALFVADGFVSGQSDWLRGHNAIRAKYADSQGDLRLRGVDYKIDGNVAFIVGAYGYGEEAASEDRGKFVLALERENATSPWKIVVDLDRSNQRTETDD